MPKAEEQAQVRTAAPVAVERVVARQPIIGVDDQVVGFQLLLISFAMSLTLVGED